MLMRTLIGAGVIAVLAGCGAAPELTGEVTEEGTVPCPEDCTRSNGTGVYTAEGGSAGIEPLRYQLMITHFINKGSSVSFQGRYFDAPSNHWLQLPNFGEVYNAVYQQETYQVTSVHERDTVPTWTLLDVATNTTTTVTDTQLLDLELYIAVPSTITTEKYVLDFDSASPDCGKQTPAGRIVRKYNMRWRDLTANAPMQYCFDAGGGADQVVFQQGIDVNPATGFVTRDTNTDVVTMSCRLGAPATVYSWGYSYRGTFAETFYFDAGIHMKRASYCGDANYYTRAGTAILIADDQHINYDDIMPNLEAWWRPTGAICVKPNNLRRKMGFDGTCNNQRLPECQNPPVIPPVPQYLADGPVNLPPLP